MHLRKSQSPLRWGTSRDRDRCQLDRFPLSNWGLLFSPDRFRQPLNTFVISKRWIALPIASGFSAIQNNSDLSQGLSPRWAAQYASLESKEADQGCRRSRFDWAIRRCAM